MPAVNMMDLARKTVGAQLIMLLGQYKTILAVEGPKDFRVYQALFGNIVFVKSNAGKDTVLEGIQTVEKDPRYKNRCRALVDRDYDFFFGRESKSSMVVYTDAHSLETQMWKLDDEYLMLSRILTETISSPENLYEALQKLKPIYSLVFDAAYKIGVFRFANEINKWRINFKDVHISPSMFDQKTEKLDLEEYIRTACQVKSNNIPSYMIYDMIDKTDELMDRKIDKWAIMQGHDIGACFIYYLKKKCKLPQTAWSNPYTAMDEFEISTRRACLMDRLKEEEFYKTIKTWAASVS